MRIEFQNSRIPHLKNRFQLSWRKHKFLGHWHQLPILDTLPHIKRNTHKIKCAWIHIQNIPSSCIIHIFLCLIVACMVSSKSVTPKKNISVMWYKMLLQSVHLGRALRNWHPISHVNTCKMASFPGEYSSNQKVGLES